MGYQSCCRRYHSTSCAAAVIPWLMICWVLCLIGPLPSLTSASSEIQWQRNLVVNGVAQGTNVSGWTQELTLPEWRCQATTTRMCGTMFSGPTDFTIPGKHMCRISQTISITTTILAEMKTIRNRQRVVINTSARLAAYNDASSFSVRQLYANGSAVSKADRVDFNATGTGNCVSKSFVSNNMTVHSSTALIWISFACLMANDGQNCDGWGTDFALSLFMESLTHSLSDEQSSTTQTTSASSEITNSGQTASDISSASLSHSISQGSPSFSDLSSSRPTLSPTKQMTEDDSVSLSRTTSSARQRRTHQPQLSILQQKRCRRAQLHWLHDFKRFLSSVVNAHFFRCKCRCTCHCNGSTNHSCNSRCERWCCGDRCHFRCEFRGRSPDAGVARLSPLCEQHRR